jgi:hypothetical protein
VLVEEERENLFTLSLVNLQPEKSQRACGSALPSAAHEASQNRSGTRS